MTDQPELSILIPSWNNREMLSLCLESLSSNTQLPYQVIVHVNEGCDGTLDWLKQRNIEHTHSSQNIGICQALNLAYQKATADYIVYLNDDMFVLPNWETQLLRPLRSSADRVPVYASGTMIQPFSISPSTVVRDYGATVETFARSQLMSDFTAGKLFQQDWNGATWPPSAVHRYWWDQVQGYSEEFSPGFYSDLDFSMKLWQLGCRDFVGVGSSLVYHFGEKTTQRMRGAKSYRVKAARKLFFNKWGILPSTAMNYYLRAGSAYTGPVSEPRLGWEKLRLQMLSTYYRWKQPLSATSTLTLINK